MLRKVAVLSVACLALGSVNASASTYATCAGQLDFTTTGSACGTAGQDILIFTSDQQSTGTGTIDSFVRMNDKGNEQGYNTDGRPLQYDENNSGQFTRSLLLSAVPIFGFSGTNYYEFGLDINQSNSSSTQLLDLNQIQFFLTSDPSLLGSTDTVSPSGQHALSFGTNAFQTYLFNDPALPDNRVTMNFNLNPGSGAGDLFVYVRTSLFDPYTSANGSYVVLFSQFGDPPGSQGSNDGFEEWWIRREGSPCTVNCGSGGGTGESPVPEPGSLILFGTGLAIVARRVRRKKH